MSLEKELGTKLDELLGSDTVSKAQKIMGSRSGVFMISIISFIESALPVPILTDPFLVAAILANRANTVKLVILATAASVVGGLCAYLMAALFFELLVQWMTSGMAEEFSRRVSDINGSSAFVLTLIGAITPIPYTIVAWAVAVIKGGLGAFIIASVIGRGFRYTIVGYSTYRFGSQAVSYAKRYIGLTSILVLVLGILYIWLKM